MHFDVQIIDTKVILPYQVMSKRSHRLATPSNTVI